MTNPANLAGIVATYQDGIPNLVGGTRGGSNQRQQTQTYGAAPVIDLALGGHAIMTVTDANAFAFGAPLINGAAPKTTDAGRHLRITIRNASGGAHGAGTFNAIFKTSAAVPAIANGFSRSFDFVWNGTNWIEQFRTAADVAN